MTTKHLSDAARILRRHLVHTDRVIVLGHSDHVWTTDSITILRLDVIQAMPLAEAGEGMFSLSIGKGLHPAEYQYPLDGPRKLLDGLAATDGWVEVVPTRWSFADASLMESDAGPAWVNCDLVAAWTETSRALGLEVKWYRQPAEAGALRPLRLEARVGPKPTFLDPRKEDPRPLETIAFVMPVRVEDPKLPRLNGAKR